MTTNLLKFSSFGCTRRNVFKRCEQNGCVHQLITTLTDGLYTSTGVQLLPLPGNTIPSQLKVQSPYRKVACKGYATVQLTDNFLNDPFSCHYKICDSSEIVRLMWTQFYLARHWLPMDPRVASTGYIAGKFHDLWDQVYVSVGRILSAAVLMSMARTF